MRPRRRTDANIFLNVDDSTANRLALADHISESSHSDEKMDERLTALRYNLGIQKWWEIERNRAPGTQEMQQMRYSSDRASLNNVSCSSESPLEESSSDDKGGKADDLAVIIEEY